jgi:multiple sugar transport system permease protein
MQIKSVQQSSILQRKNLNKATLYIILSLGAIITLAPFLWMVLGSIKTNTEIIQVPPTFLPKSPTVENYINVVTTVPFGRYMLNSVFISGVVTIAVLFTSTLAGYVFAKFNFPAKQMIFTIILATLLIPFQLSVVPLFLITWKLGIYNTYLALIVPELVSAYGIFMMRQFMHEVPNELLDAARIDGASEYRIFFTIVLPLIKPAIATLGIITFSGSWNAFLWPVIAIVNENLKTVQLAMGTFVGWRNSQYGSLMAASTMAVIPILIIFILMQRWILQGISMTGVKG